MTATKPVGASARTARVGAGSGKGPAGGPVPPGPRMRALPGTLVKLWRDRLRLLTDAAEEFGDAVRFKMGPQTLYFFNHPDHAKHVLTDNAANYHKGIGLVQAKKRILGDGLLTSEGDLWRQQRRAIQPAFRRDRIARFAGEVVREAGALITRLDAQVDRGRIDVVAEMTQLTLGVLGRTVLDADLAAFSTLGGAFEVVQNQAMFEMVTLGMLPVWLPLPRNSRFRAARRQLEEAALALVAERERGGETGGDDMLSRLLGAYSQAESGLRRRRLRDELLTILLAGHETTASTLSWTWYLIGRNPEAADRIRAEADEVFGDREPQYEDLYRLPYTTTVIQEVMRLYPPVWALTRKAVSDDVIGGYPVPAGADIMISPYTLHRHPGFWPDPGRFDPGRFSPSASGPAHRYAYIPFGAGPRVCVGSSLGMLEATFVAAMVARRFRLDPVAGSDVRTAANLSLRMHDGLPMTVRRA
jgi:enediyne biosynthesis protein E7